MKRIMTLVITVLLLTGLLAAGGAEPADASLPRRILLYTCYRQLGWGDSVQIGCVTDDGRLWLAVGNDSELKWPYPAEEQLEYLQTSDALEQIGQLNSEELFDLKGLILSTEDQGQASQPAANDAGTERSYAVQYDPEDSARCILLGMSGDDRFENTDPNAQALYLFLRRSFPQVVSYGGTMGPAGFQPVSVRAFCGMEAVNLDDLTVSAVSMDCEAGPLPLSISETDRQELLRRIREGTVTGKANATVVTGGTVCYNLLDPSGQFLASLEFYEGLLVRSDGMYTDSVPEPQS